MSEPSGGLPPSQSNPPPDPSATGEEPAPLTPAPRINPPSVFNPRDAAPSPPPGAPAGFNEFLTWMQAFGGAPAAPPVANEPPARTILAKEQKKFHRQGPEVSRADKPSLTPAVPPAGVVNPEEDAVGRSVAERTELPRSNAGHPPVPTIRKRRPSGMGGRPSRSYKFLVPWLILLALLAGSFLLGRATAPQIKPLAASPASPVFTDRGDTMKRDLTLVDQAMTAETNGEFDRATELLQQVRGKPGHVTGLDYHLALLAFEKGDAPLTMSLLDHSIAEGEEVAACYNLRGTLANRQGGINRGLPALETATQVDPFTAKYFFFWGEALRRDGKPRAALAALRQAVDRQREPGLSEFYRLKVRLTQIDLGQESEFTEQLARELKQPVPSIDWLLTAAALEMHQSHFDTAAGYLDRAQAQADPETVNLRLRDYFFFGYAREKALARFFNPVATAAKSATPVENPPAASGTPPAEVLPPAAPATTPALQP